MYLVKHISSAIDKGLRQVKFYLLGPDDTQTATEAAPHGIDSHAVKDMVGVYASTGVEGDEVLVGWLNKNRLADIGETRLYSTDADGVLQNYIWIKANGDILIGGDDNFAVKFNELKTEFNELKGVVNDLVNGLNTHVHPTAATGPPSPPTPGGSIPVIASTANIDNAKNTKIKTGS